VSLLDLVKAQYVGGKPWLIAHPETSMIAVVPLAEFKKMKATAVQELLSRRHVIATGIPRPKYEFDMAGLLTLGSPAKVVHIHG
jgi:hypothetical protein